MPGLDLPPWTLTLRDWQQEGLDDYRARNQLDYLGVATPASGKTAWALAIIHWLLSRNAVDKVVVVVPTDRLRKQWADAAGKVGIQLDPDWTNGQAIINPSFHGLVTTYQAVAKLPDLYRVLCQQRVLVIFDEIHHVGDELTWGQALLQAFGPAARRLALSGTPFRGDNAAIPFVTYRDGRSQADFTFGFGAAIGARVIRVPVFPRFEGTMTWLGRNGTRTADFAAKLTDAEATQRLRTALDPRGAWLRAVIGEANDQLSEVRRRVSPRAGGLIVTINQQHAKEVARLVREVTGEEPVLAISEDPEASACIERFAEGSSRWLVAVRLVSEGVDIPRLCTGIYATNVVTELFLRQLLGRLLRLEPGIDGQMASLFLPADPRLIAFALRVMEERDHVIESLGEEGERDGAVGGGQAPSSLFVPLSSQAEDGGVVYNGALIPAEIMAAAAQVCARFGRTATADVLFAASILKERDSRPVASSDPGVPGSGGDREPAFTLRRKMRERRQALVQVFGRVLLDITGGNERAIYQMINERIAARTGARAQEATLDQLQAHLRFLQGWVREARDAIRRGEGAQWVAQWTTI